MVSRAGGSTHRKTSSSLAWLRRGSTPPPPFACIAMALKEVFFLDLVQVETYYLQVRVHDRNTFGLTKQLLGPFFLHSTLPNSYGEHYSVMVTNIEETLTLKASTK
ncbi:hypothetical protein GOP47_0013592 [Adiantum capillus-veneris]|uniref:Uncharacterized protein n=1 Tax=Adiantum capillus-veneris TaxID=13818 RepID=A0A9D4UPI4_ADICA|nr:hypothetical protein GOP47_0013592 [Adiantum capillus-veneris]